MTPVELTIDPEFKALIQPPSAEELDLLRSQILRDGCSEAVSVWKTDDDHRILLDGHTRYKICAENQRDFQTTNIKLASREEAKLWILEHQLGRRNLTDDQRAMIWASVYAQRAAVSRARQLSEARAAKNPVLDNASKTEEPKQIKNTLKDVVKESGLSERSLRVAIKLEKTNPEVAARVRKGDLKLREARRTTAQKDKRTRYSEKDYFARIGRALAVSLADPRLTELANIRKKDFTPEAKEGLQNLILNLKEVAARARQHASALNKVLERCQ